MKKRLFALFAAPALLALAGCTTYQVNEQFVHPVPSDRVFQHQDPVPDEAIIEVTRVQNFAGGGCYFSFLINDQLAARLDTDERAVFHVPAGTYKLQVAYDWMGRGLCSCSEKRARSHGQIRWVTLKAGRSYDFRIGFNGWGGVMRLYTDEVGRPISKDSGGAKQKAL